MWFGSVNKQHKRQQQALGSWNLHFQLFMKLPVGVLVSLADSTPLRLGSSMMIMYIRRAILVAWSVFHSHNDFIDLFLALKFQERKFSLVNYGKE